MPRKAGIGLATWFGDACSGPHSGPEGAENCEESTVLPARLEVEEYCLTALLNSDTARQRTESLQAAGNGGGRFRQGHVQSADPTLQVPVQLGRSSGCETGAELLAQLYRPVLWRGQA